MRTLAKRFVEVASWPFPLLLLSEVRVSATGQRSLARMALKYGLTCVWSSSPPPSPTFSVSPGGTAVLAREPLVAREEHIPLLAQWVSASRVCSARVSFPSSSGVSSFLAIVIYGYPDSHPERDRNDELLRDVFVSLEAWTCPILVAGDLNTTVAQSATLAQADQWGFFRISPNLATTTNKEGLPAKSAPIDHMLANTRMMDMIYECKVDWGVAISDHFPILASLVLNRASFRIARWPKPPKVCPEHLVPGVPFPDPPVDCSYHDWLKITKVWLQKTIGTKVHSKNRLVTSPYKPAKLPIDLYYRRLLGVERALSYIVEHGETLERTAAVGRKLCALKEHYQLALDSLDWNECLREVRAWILQYTNHSHQNMLSKWRAEAMKWKVSVKSAYAYLRNPVPTKTTIMESAGDYTCNPLEVRLLLDTYWMTKESWPQGMSVQQAVDNLEEHYSIFLPSYPFEATFEPAHLVKAVKHAKDSAPGLDAWTLAELKILPTQAWSTLHSILIHRFEQIGETLTAVVKRVPLEKVVGASQPDQIRPIDLFSTLMRVFSSAVSLIVRPWANIVLHRNQYASKGGTFAGASRFAMYTELAFGGFKDLFAVTVDFSKMFNCLSCEVASEAARFMGLGATLIDLLAKPLRAASYIWKLPFGAVSDGMHHQRGLPQGMASSVLLAEVAISPLLWKIEAAMRGRDMAMIAYVDDLNFITTSRMDLERVLGLLLEFSEHFALDLAKEKTKIWATDPSCALQIASSWGLGITDSPSALGAQWPVHKKASPSFSKECERIRQADRRILRLRHLPSPLATKLELASSACLSLLDYLNSPTLEDIRPLRLLLKGALGHRFAAPEILFHVTTPSTLDPVLRWLMAGLKLWHAVQNADHERTDIEAILGGKNTRLTRIVAMAEKWSIRVTWGGFWLGEIWLPSREPWYVARKALLAHIRSEEFMALDKRRPGTYGGLGECNVKAHKKLLKDLSSLDQCLVMKLWSGSLLTKSKSAKLGWGTPECTCGCAEQSLQHVLWECVDSPAISEDFLHWKHLPPAQSIAHILPKGATTKEVHAWKSSCRRALTIFKALSARQPNDKRGPNRERDLDMRGHVISLMADSTYVFCAKCFISRRMRDMKWVWTRPCMALQQTPRHIGARVVLLGHDALLEEGAWKGASFRPRWRCQACQECIWATSTYKNLCPMAATSTSSVSHT